MKRLRVYVVSLGCPKNLVDTEMMMARLKESGMEIVPEPAGAQVILVNTCGFLQDAKEESLDTIFEMAAHSPEVLAVTGCMSERYRDELMGEIPDVDVLFGVHDQEGIADAVLEAYARNNGGLASLRRKRSRQAADRKRKHDAAFPPRVLATPPHTAYLRVADGCDLGCSFCVIPAIRGRQRSRPIEELVEEAKSLAATGVVELSLIAQDTGRYGTDLYGEPRLPELLDALSQTSGIRWIRLHYVNPLTITPKLVKAIAENEPVCHYVDMPIQHASDRILRAMRRGETKDTLREKVALIRRRIPDAALRTSVLIGFPGETPEDFQELLDFLTEASFDIVSVFAFSAEEGTPASEMPHQVEPGELGRRHLIAMNTAEKIAQRRLRSFLDRQVDALIDGVSDIYPDFWRGRTRMQALDVDGITYVRGPGLRPGAIVKATIIDFDGYDLFGEVRDLK